jgi:hypothetical protein
VSDRPARTAFDIRVAATAGVGKKPFGMAIDPADDLNRNTGAPLGSHPPPLLALSADEAETGGAVRNAVNRVWLHC